DREERSEPGFERVLDPVLIGIEEVVDELLDRLLAEPARRRVRMKQDRRVRPFDVEAEALRLPRAEDVDVARVAQGHCRERVREALAERRARVELVPARMRTADAVRAAKGLLEVVRPLVGDHVSIVLVGIAVRRAEKIDAETMPVEAPADLSGRG